MFKPTTKDAGVWPEKVIGDKAMQTTSQTEFSQLYRQYVTRIYRYLYARTGSKDLAEDLTAQVFLAAMQRYPSFKKHGSLPAWLFTIARNKMVDSYRKERRLVPLEYAMDRHASSSEPLAGIVAQENVAELNRVLSRLTENQREMLELRFAGELSYREIGKIIGKREGAVKMAINRLLKKLQTELEQDHV